MSDNQGDRSAAQPTLHVEVVQRRESRAARECVERLVSEHLLALAALAPGAQLSAAAGQLGDERGELAAHVASVTLCDAGHAPGAELAPAGVALALHVHKLEERGPERDALPADCAGDEDADDSACESWALPAAELHGLWESLVFEGPLKAEVLRLAETALALRGRGVDARQVPCGGALLLHGAPGTGKTSLCRALAHKLAVRHRAAFPRARLLEVDAHSLFSRWFSESGKLVARLFRRIHDLAEDPRLLTCVLIDEVESLAAARRAALAGLEPSDAIRAVNALLTALDRLRRRPNALVLATSNLPAAVDSAFLDRADLKRLVPAPGAGAAYAVLRGALLELAARRAICAAEPLFALRVLEAARFERSPAAAASLALWAVARDAVERALSARALRRLPLLALALHGPPPPAPPPPLPAFLGALAAALAQYLRDEADLADPPP